MVSDQIKGPFSQTVIARRSQVEPALSPVEGWQSVFDHSGVRDLKSIQLVLQVPNY